MHTYTPFLLYEKEGRDVKQENGKRRKVVQISEGAVPYLEPHKWSSRYKRGERGSRNGGYGNRGTYEDDSQKRSDGTGRRRAVQLPATIGRRTGVTLRSHRARWGTTPSPRRRDPLPIAWHHFGRHASLPGIIQAVSSSIRPAYGVTNHGWGARVSEDVARTRSWPSGGTPARQR